MYPMKKIMTPLIFTVLFVLITLTLPLPLYAGPPATCPCFSFADVMRYSHPPGESCSDGMYTDWNGEQVQIAKREKEDENMKVIFSAGANLTSTDEYPSIGTACYAHVEFEDEPTDRIDIKLNNASSNEITNAEAQACVDLLILLCPRPTPGG